MTRVHVANEPRRTLSCLVLAIAAAIPAGALLAVPLDALADGAWTDAGELSGSLTAPRAVPLVGGDVLVLGSPNEQTGADLFDASTAAWEHTKDLAHGHYLGVFVRLLDDRVLAVGGQSGGTTHGHAEIYDPHDRSWSSAAEMNRPRTFAAGVLLEDGRVLVSGGLRGPNQDATASAEIYNPTTDQWITTGSMRMPRRDHALLRLADGRVLAAGGGLSGDQQADERTAEIFDPATGAWRLTSSIPVPLAWADASLLPSGRVLIIGTSPYGGANQDRAWVFDPSEDDWTSTEPMPFVPDGASLVRLPNGGILTVGRGRGPEERGVAAVYVPAHRAWFEVARPPDNRTGYAIARTGDRVLVALGRSRAASGASVPETSALIYIPSDALPRPTDPPATPTPQGTPSGIKNVVVTISCRTNPERVTITNRRATAISVISIGSRYQPRQDEPFEVSRRLGPGARVTYRFGPSTGPNRLSRRFIFNDTSRREAVRVRLPGGVIVKPCA